MEERVKGITIALTLVALAALSVSFFSAVKAKSGQQQVQALRAETQKLNRANRSLEENLRQTEQKYEQQTQAARELKEALDKEQLKNKVLAEELQQQQQKSAKVLPNAEVKVSKSNVKTR